jgi:membrane-bound lytic murein transglycosylase D
MASRLLRILALLLVNVASCAALAAADAHPPEPPVVAEPVPLQIADDNAGAGLKASADRVLDLHDHLPRVLTLDLTRDANDIWDRIRRGFGMAELDSELVVEQQLFYLNRPGYLKKVFERGGRYLYHIVDELERRGMPTELALLPMVESSYNPMAHSRARASGLWQFIPSTGRNYNLTQDTWVDERRDVIASTAAALDYLQNIYEMHGDWQLALASYNWGEGAVGRAIKRNVADGLPPEYAHLRMPAETRNYIPKLQALKNIVARPELFGFELPYVPNSRHFVTVDAPPGIDLAAAARLADMTLEEFVALNPGYNRPAIAAEGASLVVPVDRAEQFRLRLAERQGSNERWRTHRLKRGETLTAVARRAGLSLAQLRQLNGLDARSRVSTGYALLVPDGVDPSGALAATRLVPPARPSRSAKHTTRPGKSATTKARGPKKSSAKAVSRRAGKPAASGNATRTAKAPSGAAQAPVSKAAKAPAKPATGTATPHAVKSVADAPSSKARP